MNTAAAGFLDHPTLYASAQREWSLMWNQIDPLWRTSDEWETPWLLNPIRDGNPIFSAVSRPQGRGVRVCQFPPQSSGKEFFSWFDTFGDSQDREIRELVISCSLSDRNLHLARRLIEAWITGTVNIAPFEAAREADSLSAFPVPPSFAAIAA